MQQWSTKPEEAYNCYLSRFPQQGPLRATLCATPTLRHGAPTRGYATTDFARNQKLDRSFFGRAGNRNLSEVCRSARSPGDTRTWNTYSRSVGLSHSTAEMFEMQVAPSCSKSTQDGGYDRRSSISTGANRVPLQPR